MNKIILVCSAGMSTSILVTKMEKSAAEQGIEATIEAHSSANLDNEVGKWDVCLVGPQLRYAVEDVKNKLGVPTEVIDMRVYGTANGEKALEHALSLIEKNV